MFWNMNMILWASLIKWMRIRKMGLVQKLIFWTKTQDFVLPYLRNNARSESSSWYKSKALRETFQTGTCWYREGALEEGTPVMLKL